jgi:hypothetical protein
MKHVTSANFARKVLEVGEGYVWVVRQHLDLTNRETVYIGMIIQRTRPSLGQNDFDSTIMIHASSTFTWRIYGPLDHISDNRRDR